MRSVGYSLPLTLKHIRSYGLNKSWTLNLRQDFQVQTNIKNQDYCRNCLYAVLAVVFYTKYVMKIIEYIDFASIYQDVKKNQLDNYPTAKDYIEELKSF